MTTPEDKDERSISTEESRRGIDLQGNRRASVPECGTLPVSHGANLAARIDQLELALGQYAMRPGADGEIARIALKNAAPVSAIQTNAAPGSGGQSPGRTDSKESPAGERCPVAAPVSTSGASPGVKVAKHFKEQRDSLADLLRDIVGRHLLPPATDYRARAALEAIPTRDQQVDNLLRGLAELMAEEEAAEARSASGASKP